MNYLRTFFELIKETFAEWSRDRVPLLAAALAYYTAFALAPLIVIVVAVMGLVMSESNVQAQIIEQIESEIGPGAAEVVTSLIENITDSGQGLISSVIGTVALLIGAIGLFSNLQTALNIIWGVDHVKRQTGIRRFIKDKLLSFGMILVIGFLLLVSLVLSTLLSVFDSYLFELISDARIVLRIFHETLAFIMTTLVFMAMYKILPHAEIQWRDVWIGAAFTAFLFTVGRLILSFYLGSSTDSVYGAAGAFALILIWVYYSAQIILFGAEFTEVFARRYGSQVEAIVPARSSNEDTAQDQTYAADSTQYSDPA